MDQIVGADGEEVDFTREQRRGEGGRRHFDHDADRHGRRGDPALEQFRPRPRSACGRCGLLHRRYERKHHPQRAVLGGAQQRPHLGLENVRLGEAEADAAQAGMPDTLYPFLFREPAASSAASTSGLASWRSSAIRWLKATR